jgi:hypothetical protein
LKRSGAVGSSFSSNNAERPRNYLNRQLFQQISNQNNPRLPSYSSNPLTNDDPVTGCGKNQTRATAIMTRVPTDNSTSVTLPVAII